jgi:F-type H+-transporting ATPase subunit gamma
MSQLVKLRQRIKTVKTIQKITQAMRLVSMSIHSQLSRQTTYLKEYQNELDKIFTAVKLPEKQLLNQKAQSNKSLLILIGSQKGLCSSFNQDIFKKFNSNKQLQQQVELLVIGKKLIDLVQCKNSINKKLPKFSHTTINEITNKIFNYITEQQNFTTVSYISNHSKSFFAHKTKNANLIPFEHTNSNHPAPKEDYLWEQPQVEIAHKLAYRQLKLNIYNALFDSLVAEYAARFRSMDSATRNADSLLETTQRQYNKMRQAKITSELVELSAIFQTK